MQRVAVGRYLPDRLSADIAAGARMTFDNELLSETL